ACPRHAPHNWASKIVCPGLVPRHDAPDNRKYMIGHRGAIFLGDFIEQSDNIKPADFLDWLPAEPWVYEASEHGARLISRAQPTTLKAGLAVLIELHAAFPLEILFADVLKSVATLGRVGTVRDGAQRFAGLCAGFLWSELSHCPKRDPPHGCRA